ncbi:GNAT family N-acetyltransferase [Blastococcus sp. SYSU D00820]
MPDGTPTFRPLRRSDFDLLARWLAEPLVARWWAHDPAAVEADFGPSVDGADATEMLLACSGDVPFGLVQRYPIAAYPEYVEELSPLVELPPGALSIDYLIGEPAARGGGGSRMIAAAVAGCWARYPDARDVVVPVALGNVASWRALEKAGFERIAEGPLTPDNPIDPPDHVVYRIRRPGPRAG